MNATTDRDAERKGAPPPDMRVCMSRFHSQPRLPRQARAAARPSLSNSFLLCFQLSTAFDLRGRRWDTRRRHNTASMRNRTRHNLHRPNDYVGQAKCELKNLK